MEDCIVYLGRKKRSQERKSVGFFSFEDLTTHTERFLKGCPDFTENKLWVWQATKLKIVHIFSYKRNAYARNGGDAFNPGNEEVEGRFLWGQPGLHTKTLSKKKKEKKSLKLHIGILNFFQVTLFIGSNQMSSVLFQI